MLHEAVVARCDEELLALLLKFDASSTSLTDAEGDLPLHLSCRANCEAVVKLLLQYMGPRDINCANYVS